MDASGTPRRIDRLGRVVVPADIRRSFGLHEGDLVAVHVEGERIVMAKVGASCAICGRADDLVEVRAGEKHVCRGCVAELGPAA
ncbi:MAG: AbrB/MazE/SpoVT family DNA-binding domain-containing protein [Actinomycetota bacterium]